jgi:hypothetical protein
MTFPPAPRFRKKLMRFVLLVVVSFGFAAIPWRSSNAEGDEVAAALETIRQVGPGGKGHREAIAASRRLAKVEAKELPLLLAGMDGANPLAMNWIHAAVDGAAERTLRGGKPLPQEQLERFLADKQHNPRARRLAFEWLQRVDPSARRRLISSMLNDPSLELRRDAVAVALEEAGMLAGGGKNPEAISAYQTALSAARDRDQVDAAADALAKLGVAVDLPTHFGFIMRWKLIGPFDNTNLSGFDAVFSPEQKIDLAGEYEGKAGKVAWFEYRTDDRYGLVDLNRAIGKHIGVTAYAYYEFVSSAEREVDLRLASINANKLWLNGELLTANEVYHTNTGLDQYIGRAWLKQGANTILVKVCQNEQTEDWAQRWEFQLRVCDETGTAVLSERKAP